MNNSLDGTLRWYLVARDALRVTRRVFDRKTLDIIMAKHCFFHHSREDAIKEIDKTELDLNNSAVVALVAAFERSFRDHLQTILKNSLLENGPVIAAMKIEFKDEIEYWNLKDPIIDKIFNLQVEPDLRGQVKQIIVYRNAVAHGHPIDGDPPEYSKPKTVHKRLTEFMRQCGVTV